MVTTMEKENGTDELSDDPVLGTETGEVEADNNDDFTGGSRERSRKTMRLMVFLTVMAAIGGFLFGYDTGVISGAMLPIQQAFNLSKAQEEAVVSSTVLAAFVSSLVGGSMNRALGRKACILIAAAVFTLGSFCLASAWDFPSLVAGRVVVGVGIGIASLTTPIYIAELATPSIRGQLVTVNILLVTIGQFVAGMVDGVFEQYVPVNGWRFMLGLASVPSIIMFVWFLILPESSRWLAMKGRNDEALQVLKDVRYSDREAQNEMNDIVLAVGDAAEGSSGETDGSNENEKKPFTTQVIDMVSDPPTRRALILGCGMMMLQQLCGINTVMVSALHVVSYSYYGAAVAVTRADSILIDYISSRPTWLHRSHLMILSFPLPLSLSLSLSPCLASNAIRSIMLPASTKCPSSAVSSQHIARDPYLEFTHCSFWSCLCISLFGSSIPRLPRLLPCSLGHYFRCVSNVRRIMFHSNRESLYLAQWIHCLGSGVWYCVQHLLGRASRSSAARPYIIVLGDTKPCRTRWILLFGPIDVIPRVVFRHAVPPPTGLCLERCDDVLL